MESILVINAKTKDVGGFPVRRALPAIERRMIGPFIFLDQMGPARLAAGQGLAVRPHPHIGLSTMTYLFEGEILHRDSLGTIQRIQPGAVNFMTAGSGIAHSERTPLEAGDAAALSGIQFWAALPRSLEEMAPAFLHLDASDLPLLSDGKLSARIIAGGAFGLSSPLDAPHPMLCVDIAAMQGVSFEVPAEYPERALYVADGSIELAGVRYREGHLVVLPTGLSADVRALSNARLMLLGGEPMDGPRHIWWNFVASSSDRIEQAKRDWKLGRFARVPDETEFIPLPE
jgi:redox-sensitive bicupin YhaK (pirin superfamily)